jgi:hypothetical protein
MMINLIRRTAGLIRRTGGLTGPVLGLLALFSLLTGCPPFNPSYHVYYEGNNNTGGFAPVDSKVYFSGDTALVLDKPEALKKGDLDFLGWRLSGSDTLFQPGEKISIGYSDIWLYAWWEDDPYYIPYEYADDPATGGKIITRYDPYDYTPTLTIPETLGGGPVTAIGEGAFSGVYLDEIVLPGQLAVIGNKAFSGAGIRTIAIPDTVTSIGNLAFLNCNMETLSLGSGLEAIGDYAFDGNHLTTLLLPEKTKTLGEGAFYGNRLITIEISGNVTIESNTSLGVYGASFRSYYTAQASQAGVYLYNSGGWRGPFSE